MVIVIQALARGRSVSVCSVDCAPLYTLFARSLPYQLFLCSLLSSQCLCASLFPECSIWRARCKRAKALKDALMEALNSATEHTVIETAVENYEAINFNLDVQLIKKVLFSHGQAPKLSVLFLCVLTRRRKSEPSGYLNTHRRGEPWSSPRKAKTKAFCRPHWMPPEGWSCRSAHRESLILCLLLCGELLDPVPSVLYLIFLVLVDISIQCTCDRTVSTWLPWNSTPTW